MVVVVVVVVVVRAFLRFLHEEPVVGEYTEVQKAWQAWTFMDLGQKNSGQDGRAGGGAMRRGAILAGGFLHAEVAGG